MFLSIVIPVYNAEKYIEECLSSCIDQNMDTNDYEIICINDGSADGSFSVLQRYAATYENIRIFDRQNKGVSATRNEGLSLAKGEYIWFVDSDDFIRQNCLQELKNLAKNSYDIINFGGYSFNERFTENEKQRYLENKLEANKTYWGHACFHLYRTSTIRNNHLSLVEEIRYGEDELFYNDMFECSSNVAQVNTAYYFYRQNPTSAMNNLSTATNQEKRLDSMIVSMVILKEGMENGKYTKSFSREFLQDRYRKVQYCFGSLKLKTAGAYYKKMKAYGLLDRKAVNGIKIPGKCRWFGAYLKRRLKIHIKHFIKK